MRLAYFGDSFDLVKRSLIASLADFGPWSVQPMFTELVSRPDAARFARFLGATLVSGRQLASDTDRSDFLQSSMRAHALLLDPDTGLKENVRHGKRPHYLLFSELSDLVAARPRELTVVFDQSVARAKDDARRNELGEKLKALAELNVSACYYFSHAPCLIASRSKRVLRSARRVLLRSARLPESRLLCGPAA